MPNLHFAHKLALTMTALVLLASILIGYPLVYRQFSLTEEQFNATGEALVNQLAANATELVFTDDKLSLENLIIAYEEQSNVVSAAIVNRDSKITQTKASLIDSSLLESPAYFQSKGVFTDKNFVSWYHKPLSFQGVVGGVAWVGIDKAEMIKNQKIIVTSALTMVAVLVLAIMWLAVRLSRTLSKPINDLTQAVKAIENGHFSFRIRNEHSGEFTGVKEAFNNMAEGLEQKLLVEKNFNRFVSSPVANYYKDRKESEITLQGELVEASILYVDLVNYTGFSENHTPERVAEVLNFYFAEFSDACHKFHGNVDKFIGDCAMLVFGCPVDDPMHREHALYCAVYIRNKINELNLSRQEQHLPWLNIRIGLASGTVLAGLLGSPERLNYSVIGSAANLAARLCDKAPTGEILTDRNFLSALPANEKISTHQTQRIHVKGFSEEVDTLVVDKVTLPDTNTLT